MSNSEEHKSEAPGHNKDYKIIVNGREVAVGHKLAYAELINLAFPGTPIGDQTIYTVTYVKGEDKKPEGSMVAGDVITVKEGMVFNVTATLKS